MLAKLTTRYGWRGTLLIVAGAFWVFFGVGLFFMVPGPRTWVAFDYVPHWVDAAGWWITGGIAIRQGLAGAPNDGVDDSAGYSAIFIMPITRVLSFTMSWIVWLISGGVAGYSQGWYSAAVWLLPLMLLTLAARRPDPRVVIPHPPQEL